MTTPREMHIPKSPQDGIVYSVLYVFAFLSTSLAIANIFNRVGILASSIWIALVTTILWSASKDAGGSRKLLINCLGSLFGHNFVEATSPDAPAKEIRFGFNLFGRKIIRRSLPIERIESVYWSTGQATSMAGRDMNDWSICLWFDHRDLARSERERKIKYRKPDQEVYIVGPERRKKITEKFGLDFAEFLRESGAQLVRNDKDNGFDRCKTPST